MLSLPAVGMPNPLELMIIALVVLLLFGNRLPGLMRSLGSSVVEFKKGINEADRAEADAPAETRVEPQAEPKVR